MDKTLLIQTIIHIFLGLFAGVLISLSYWISSKNQRFSKNFAATLFILPAIVSVLIFVIGSDLAKAVSIGGIFAFIRFRSVPGDSKDILLVFFAMATGLCIGVGFYALAFVFALIIALAFILASSCLNSKNANRNLCLKITVPEDMNYKDAFDDIFEKYLDKSSINLVRTSNMGTLFTITYNVTLKKDCDTKVFLDELRCRNGNLNILLGPSYVVEGSAF